MTPHGGDPSLPPHEDDESIDMGWLAQAVRENPANSAANSAATSSLPPSSGRTTPRMPSFPDMPAAYRHHSQLRPVSAESNFPAAASSPSTYMTQVGPLGQQGPLEPGPTNQQGSLNPGSIRLVTSGIRSSTALAEPPPAGQEVQRSLRSRAGGESTTGTAQGTAPNSTSPRHHGRMLRSRSGTTSEAAAAAATACREESDDSLLMLRSCVQTVVKDEEMQDAGPDSPGVFRSLRRRPQPNYAQAAGAASGDSESDASSVPKSEGEKRNSAEPKKLQRGRKRRTEPITVVNEDGTTEKITPQEARRRRRRVTNRKSARNCRQKKIEEQHKIAAEAQRLQQENTVLQAHITQLQTDSRLLRRQADYWRSQCEQLVGRPLGTPQQQMGGPSRMLTPFASPNPPAEMRTQSLPVPHLSIDAEVQDGSTSPGGFDSFTVAAAMASQHMLSPQSQQTPVFSTHTQQPHTPLSFDSGPGAAQLSSGFSRAGMPHYADSTGLQPGANSIMLQSTPEHEQLHGGQAGMQYRLQLSSSPSSIPTPQQQLPPSRMRARREGGPSHMYPRHFSAPTPSYGVFGAMELLEARARFCPPGAEANNGGYVQPSLQSQASFGQSSPRSPQYARASGSLVAEEEMNRSPAPAALQQSQEDFGMAFRDGVPSPSPRQHPHWGVNPNPQGSSRE